MIHVIGFVNKPGSESGHLSLPVRDHGDSNSDRGHGECSPGPGSLSRVSGYSYRLLSLYAAPFLLRKFCWGVCVGGGGGGAI